MLLWSSFSHPLKYIYIFKNEQKIKQNKTSTHTITVSVQASDASKFCLKDSISIWGFPYEVTSEQGTLTANGFDNIKINKTIWKALASQAWDLPSEQLYSIIT